MPRGYPEEKRERLARIITERVVPRLDVADPKRAHSAIARVLDTDQSTISRLLTRNQGGSIQLAEAVARYLSIPLSTVTDGAPDESPVRQYRDLPGFAEAMSDAVRRAAQEHPTISKADLEAAGDMRSVPEPQRINAGLLISVALALKPDPKSEPQSGRIKRKR